MIRVNLVVLGSMMTLLAGGSYGADLADRIIRELDSKNQSLKGQLSEQKVETQSLREQLGAQQTENQHLKQELVNETGTKKQLEQKHAELSGHLAKIKEVTGGSGSGTPVSKRAETLHQKTQVVDSLEQMLQGLPGDNLLDKVGSLQKTLAAAEEERKNFEQKYREEKHQTAELSAEIDPSAGETPPPVRLRALSSSFKKNTTNLKEAVTAVGKRLEPFEGGDYESKLDDLLEQFERMSVALSVLETKLEDVPGDGLIEKIKLLKHEIKSTNER